MSYNKDDWRNQYRSATTRTKSQFQYMESTKHKTNQYVVIKNNSKHNTLLINNNNNDSNQSNTSWNNLSTDVLIQIFQYHSINELIIILSLVSKHWYNIILYNDTVWKYIVLNIGAITSDQHILNINNISHVLYLEMNNRGIYSRAEQHMDGSFNVLINHLSHVAPNLIHLQLRHGYVMDYTLSNIITMKKLHLLDLTGNDTITHNGIKLICTNLIHLHTLKLGQINLIDDNGLQQLSKLHRLTNLAFTYCVYDKNTTEDIIINKVTTICESVPLLQYLRVDQLVMNADILQIISSHCKYLNTLFCFVSETFTAMHALFSIQSIHTLHIHPISGPRQSSNQLNMLLDSHIDITHIRHVTLVHQSVNSDILFKLLSSSNTIESVNINASFCNFDLPDQFWLTTNLQSVGMNAVSHVAAMQQQEYINYNRQQHDLSPIQFNQWTLSTDFSP